MVEVKAKLWLDRGGEFVLGKGRARLLSLVRETGSMAEAARAMRMSYSHAWSDIDAISKAMGGDVVESASGGRRGGRTCLTRLGERLLRRFETEAKLLERHLSKRNR